LLALQNTTNVYRQDAEKRLREEIAELDASLDQCQEVKRGTLNKIRSQREASAKLDLEVQAVGKCHPIPLKGFQLSRKNRGKNSAIEQGNCTTQ
jgi:hypothetical protein